MNILFISVRADMGGGPKHLLDLATYFRNQKDVNISIASPWEQPFASPFKDLADHYIKIPKRKFTPWHFIKLVFHCRKHDIRIVHSHGRGAGVYGRLLSLFGIRCFHTFHGIHIENNLAGKLKLLLDKWLHHLTSQYICVSAGEKDKFLELEFNKVVPVTIIENGIDVERIKKEFIEKRKTNPEFTLGTLARLHFQKGIDLLIETIMENKTFFQEKKIRILIAGNGPEKDKYQQMIYDSQLSAIIELCGETNDPVGFLARLNVYISFARWEGLPLSVLEAKACELPTLLSDVTGHQGFETLFKSSSNFVDILEKWMEQLPGTKPLEDKFTLKTMGEKTWQLYQ